MQAHPSDAAAELMQTALAASKVGTWEWNIEDDILRCDPTAAAMFGIPQERAMNGAPLGFFVDRLHPEDCQRLGTQVAELRRRGGPYVGEYRTVPRPGEIRWVLARGHFDRDASGTIGRACGVVIDVTESKQDGYVDGNAFLVADHVPPATALENVVDQALKMRAAAETIEPEQFEVVKPMVHALLFKLGCMLAAETDETGALAERGQLH